ncbi:hypothetical protein M885DRAFT_613887 [Pelagophyceae sp. CCMP2097]|nr:hypothetical protein M885DRAFT_613887 [Pelagophyceae sp. CCMP2097]
MELALALPAGVAQLPAGGGLEQLVEVWVTYAKTVIDANQVASPAARAAIVDAFELAVANVGCVPDSTPIWSAYARYVESWPSSDANTRGARVLTLRRLLQRAVVIPIAGLEDLWRLYERFEHAESEVLAKELLQRYEPLYCAARAAVHDRRTCWDRAGDNLRGWRACVAFEKATAQVSADALVASTAYDDAIARRVTCAYRVGLTLTQAPELYHEFAATVATRDAEGHALAAPAGSDAADAIYRAGCEFAPTCVLVHAARAEHLERQKKPLEARLVLENLVVASPNDAVAWVLLERHERRYNGVEAGRRVFARTRDLRSACDISADIYVAHASIELHMNGDSEVAMRVLELGLKQRPELTTDASYVLGYAALLEQKGDARNARALLERALSRLDGECDRGDMDDRAADAAAGRRSAPFWDALASLVARTTATPDAATAVAKIDERRLAAHSAARGDAVWHSVSALGIGPTDAHDVRWCVRAGGLGMLEAVPDLATLRARSQKTDAARRARELDGDDDVAAALMDAGFAAPREKSRGGPAAGRKRTQAGLTDPLRRLMERLPRHAPQHSGVHALAMDRDRIEFVLDALQNAVFPATPPALPPQQRKRRGRDDEDEDEDEDDAQDGPLDAFKRRRQNI